MLEDAAAEQQSYLRHLPLNADLDATRFGAGLGAAWRCLALLADLEAHKSQG